MKVFSQWLPKDYLAVHCLVAVFFLVCFVSCPRPIKIDTIKPRIIFILIDALRKDHLSCYGYERNTTPVIDRLAADGVQFLNAISQSPWTTPSMASIFTSKYPSQIGVGCIEKKGGLRHLMHYSVTKLPAREVTLAEVLRKNGYRTISVTTNGLSADPVGMLQGFVLKSHLVYRNAEVVTSKAIDFLKAESEKRGGGHFSEPFFLYIHYMDVHEPTNPPAPYNQLYPTIDRREHRAIHFRWAFTKPDRLGSKDFEIYRSHKIALYDGALRFIDRQLKRLIDFLEEEGLLAKTVFIISSDHGEELWDHAVFEKTYRKDPRGFYGVDHGHTMFRELLDVPLIISGWNVPSVKIRAQVRNIDIAPTIVGIAGIRGDRWGFSPEGKDLLKLIRKGRVEDMVAFSEDIAYGYEEKCIQTSRYKYIRGRGYEFLFDKKNDGRELKNLAAVRKELRDVFSAKLDEFLNSIKRKVNVERAVFDPETIQQLRYLGYIE